MRLLLGGDRIKLANDTTAEPVRLVATADDSLRDRINKYERRWRGADAVKSESRYKGDIALKKPMKSRHYGEMFPAYHATAIGLRSVARTLALFEGACTKRETETPT